jgi:hypothetical protein
VLSLIVIFAVIGVVRWHGYHPDQHTEVVEQYNKLDEERRRARQEAQENARTVRVVK